MNSFWAGGTIYFAVVCTSYTKKIFWLSADNIISKGKNSIIYYGSSSNIMNHAHFLNYSPKIIDN